MPDVGRVSRSPILCGNEKGWCNVRITESSRSRGMAWGMVKMYGYYAMAPPCSTGVEGVYVRLGENTGGLLAEEGIMRLDYPANLQRRVWPVVWDEEEEGWVWV